MDMEANDPEEVSAPAVMARLSAVSLTEVSAAEHNSQQEQEDKGALEPSVTQNASNVGIPSTMANTLPPLEMGASHHHQQALLQAEKQDPCWAEMLPDPLAKIFSRLSLRDRLCTIPCVCRYWQCVVQDAACWQNIDLLEWSYDKQPKVVDRMLLLLLNRSQGGLRRVCVPNLQNDSILQLISSSGSQLQVLQIPDSFVSEECLCEMVSKLSSLTYLDISGRFPSRALLESCGKHCQLITRLNVNMPLDLSDTKSCDVAALAVAQYMPQLQHLEMSYGLLSNVGLKALIENCTSLEHLDLRGCWHVDVEDSLILELRKRIRNFLPPVYDFPDYDVDEDDFNSECMFEDPEYFDEVAYDDLDMYDDVGMYDEFEGFDGEEVSMDEEETC